MTDDLLSHVIAIATAEVGVREVAPNRGPRVDEYIRSVGLDPARGSFPWCAAFVYWAFAAAARTLGVRNPCPRTASAMKMYQKAPLYCRMGALMDPGSFKPGWVAVKNHGFGKGHIWIVTGADFRDGTMATVEGNTNSEGGREGVEVARRTRRFDEVFGYLDFSQAEPVG